MSSAENVKEVASMHRMFLALVACAVNLRAKYTKSGVDIFQEELNKMYEPVREKIQQEFESEVVKEINKGKTKDLVELKEKAFRRSHHKLVVKPLADKNKEEDRINRLLYNIMKDSHPDSIVVLMTQVMQETMKAKDPREIVLIMDMYNKGMFDEALKVLNPQKKDNEESSNAGPAIISLGDSNV